MKKRKLELLAAAAVSGLLIVGCGGRTDRDSSAAGGGSGASGDIGTSVSALMAYMEGLIATDENGDPVDINGLTLATDDTAEPLPVNP